MISPKKWKILTALKNLPRNAGDLDKLIAAKGFKKLPKVQKMPNLVTLIGGQIVFIENAKNYLMQAGMTT